MFLCFFRSPNYCYCAICDTCTWIFWSCESSVELYIRYKCQDDIYQRYQIPSTHNAEAERRFRKDTDQQSRNKTSLIKSTKFMRCSLSEYNHLPFKRTGNHFLTSANRTEIAQKKRMSFGDVPSGNYLSPKCVPYKAMCQIK